MSGVEVVTESEVMQVSCVCCDYQKLTLSLSQTKEASQMYHLMLTQQPRGSTDVLTCHYAAFSSLCLEFSMSVFLSPNYVLEFP